MKFIYFNKPQPVGKILNLVQSAENFRKERTVENNDTCQNPEVGKEVFFSKLVSSKIIFSDKDNRYLIILEAKVGKHMKEVYFFITKPSLENKIEECEVEKMFVQVRNNRLAENLLLVKEEIIQFVKHKSFSGGVLKVNDFLKKNDNGEFLLEKGDDLIKYFNAYLE